MPEQNSKFVNAEYYPVLVGNGFTTGETVNIQVFELFDSPSQSGVEVLLNSSGCTEVGGVGRFVWSAVNLVTQPLNRMAVMYLMSGVTSGQMFDGESIFASPESDGITSNFPEDGYLPNAGDGFII